MDPEMLELIRSILEGGAQSGQLDPQADQTQALVDQLRQGAGPQELMNARGIPVSHGIAGLIGQVANGAGAQMQQNKLTGIRQQQAGIRAQQNQAMIEALRRMQTPQPGVTPGFNSGAQPPQDPYQQFQYGSNT